MTKKTKKMEISWYIKLNIMVLCFFFVLLLMKQTAGPSFKSALNAVFVSPSLTDEKTKRSARIQTGKKVKN